MRESALDTGPSFGMVAGWDSRMVYHGEDWIQRGTGSPNDSDSSGAWYARASAEWKGFAAYVGYLQSSEKVDPRDVRVDNEYYSEFQAGASYTHSVIPGILDASAGYNAFFLNSESFIGYSYNGEAFVRVAYKQIPFITASVSAFYLHGDSGSVVQQQFGTGFIPIVFDVDGWIYEARIDGNFKLFNFGREGFVALNPFVTLVIDGGRWVTDSDPIFRPHNLQYGLNVPIAVNKSLSFNVNANLYQPLIERDLRISYPEFWGGASVSYKF